MSAAYSLLKRCWWYVRQVSGDADYENYLRRAKRSDSRCAAAVSAEEFYLDRLRRKYTGISRCC